MMLRPRRAFLHRLGAHQRARRPGPVQAERRFATVLSARAACGWTIDPRTCAHMPRDGRRGRALAREIATPAAARAMLCGRERCVPRSTWVSSLSLARSPSDAVEATPAALQTAGRRATP